MTRCKHVIFYQILRGKYQIEWVTGKPLQIRWILQSQVSKSMSLSGELSIFILHINCNNNFWGFTLRRLVTRIDNKWHHMLQVCSYIVAFNFALLCGINASLRKVVTQAAKKLVTRCNIFQLVLQRYWDTNCEKIYNVALTLYCRVNKNSDVIVQSEPQWVPLFDSMEISSEIATENFCRNKKSSRS